MKTFSSSCYNKNLQHCLHYSFLVYRLIIYIYIANTKYIITNSDLWTGGREGCGVYVHKLKRWIIYAKPVTELRRQTTLSTNAFRYIYLQRLVTGEDRWSCAGRCKWDRVQYNVFYVYNARKTVVFGKLAYPGDRKTAHLTSKHTDACFFRVVGTKYNIIIQ